MIEVLLGLGSNVGLSEQILKEAVEQIRNLKEVLTLKSSPVFLTAPLSPIEQNDFFNLVCLLEMEEVDPHYFFKRLEKIERDLGKVPKGKDEPRRIDIDILLFGRSFIRSDKLDVPHPKMLERLFVLEPLICLKEEILFPVSKTYFERLDLKSLVKKLQKNEDQIVKRLSENFF